jgi:hypothetical protein
MAHDNSQTKQGDSFMHARRSNPRPEFVASLREELNDLDTPSQQTTQSPKWTLKRERLWQRVAAVCMMLAGLFAVSFAVSPEVRAMTRSLLGIEGEVPLEIAQKAIGFELPQYLPDGIEMVSLCSSALNRACDFTGAQAWVSLSEEGSGWAGVYYTHSDTETDNRTVAMTLSVITYHPNEDMESLIEQREKRWTDLGDIGSIYNAPRIGQAIGYQTYRTRDGIARATTIEWFQDDLKYILRLYNIPPQMPTDDFLAEARQIARSIPSSGS